METDEDEIEVVDLTLPPRQRQITEAYLKLAPRIAYRNPTPKEIAEQIGDGSRSSVNQVGASIRKLRQKGLWPPRVPDASSVPIPADPPIDVELKILAAIVAAIEPLDPAARVRVVRYLAARYGLSVATD